jgi:hypothetical protein
LLNKLKALEKENDNLRDELEALYEQLDMLAAALGACPACFGSDRDCAECGGRGRPGAYHPDLALYRSIVLPAVRRAQIESREPRIGEPRTALR